VQKSIRSSDIHTGITTVAELETKFQALASTPPHKRFWLKLQASKIAWTLAPQPWFWW